MAFLRDRSVFCIPNSILDNEERYFIGGICMVTSTAGFVGAALQIKSLRQYRDRQRRRPSPNPSIIFYLALSDLVACIGVFVLAICLMSLEEPERVNHHEFKPTHEDFYVPLGVVTEAVTLFAYIASYIWTMSYALDMCFQIHQIECSMAVYHILAWLIPLDFVASIEGVNLRQYPDVCERYYGRLSRLLLTYFPVLVVLLANPILFLVTYRKVKQQLRSSGRFTNVDREALNVCKKKFFWIVVAFTACWLPNIFSVSYDLLKFNHTNRKSALDDLWFLEAFLNPLQGLFNYFVYRRSFKVTATDTRHTEGSLRRVRRSPSLGRFVDKLLSKPSTRDTVHREAQVSINQDERNPLLSSLPLSRGAKSTPYVYTSKLLGESK